MDTLVLLHTCPHPLNAAASSEKSVLLRFSRSCPADDDFCLNSRPENRVDSPMPGCIAFAAGMHAMRHESALPAAAAVFRGRIDAGDYGSNFSKGPGLRSSTSRAISRPTRCFSMPPILPIDIAQWTPSAKQGNVYLSKNSSKLLNLRKRIAQIVADTVGRHDTLGGACGGINSVRYAWINAACIHAATAIFGGGAARRSGPEQAGFEPQHQLS